VGSGPAVIRCPRCAARSDAVARVEYALSDEEKSSLARYLDIITHELGIETDGEAVVEAARRLALDLNQ
jgi:hypothetical protein